MAGGETQIASQCQAPRACPCRRQDRGKCRELLAIELPELAELLVLEGLDIAITADAAAVARRDVCRIRRGFRDELIEPAAAAGNR